NPCLLEGEDGGALSIRGRVPDDIDTRALGQGNRLAGPGRLPGQEAAALRAETQRAAQADVLAGEAVGAAAYGGICRRKAYLPGSLKRGEDGPVAPGRLKDDAIAPKTVKAAAQGRTGIPGNARGVFRNGRDGGGAFRFEVRGDDPFDDIPEGEASVSDAEGGFPGRQFDRLAREREGTLPQLQAGFLGIDDWHLL